MKKLCSIHLPTFRHNGKSEIAKLVSEKFPKVLFWEEKVKKRLGFHQKEVRTFFFFPNTLVWVNTTEARGLVVRRKQKPTRRERGTLFSLNNKSHLYLRVDMPYEMCPSRGRVCKPHKGKVFWVEETNALKNFESSTFLYQSCSRQESSPNFESL